MDLAVPAHSQPKIERLGKKQLGPYAFEERMPQQLSKVIHDENDENKFKGIPFKLSQCIACRQDYETAIICDLSAVQVTMIPKEGHTFCGYRNIQMLLLSIQAKYTSKLPDLTIPSLQRAIELAWNAGFNPHGRIETGGIVGTRKHIGTSEAQALFEYLGIPCTGRAIHGPNAATQLVDFVKGYFLQSGQMSKQETVLLSTRPPIFLQRPGHSITVVGYTKSRKGRECLLVFDPAREVPSTLHRLEPLDESVLRRGWSVRSVLWQYRRRVQYFQRYGSFETLTVDLP